MPISIVGQKCMVGSESFLTPLSTPLESQQGDYPPLVSPFREGRYQYIWSYVGSWLRSPCFTIPRGGCILPPKTKRNPKSTIKTLTEIIGHSPDEADALVLAIHAMSTETKRKKAGAMV
jgi:hypothetical protein